MKKLFATLLALMLLTPACAMACQEAPIIPANCAGATVFDDPVWLPLTAAYRIPGIKSVSEQVHYLSIQRVEYAYVDGWTPTGMLRQDGQGCAIRVIISEETVIGLTRLNNVTFAIFPEFLPMVTGTVEQLYGEGTPVCARTIAGCMLWMAGDYVSVIFFPSTSDRFQIGAVSFNGGEDVTPLYAGTFDGCGGYRIGLAPGLGVPETVAVTVEATAEANANANASAEASAGAYVNVSNAGTVDNSGDGCYRNNLMVQINFFSIVRQGIKIIKECLE